MSDRKIISDLVEVIADTLVSIFLLIPVKLRELQFCELIVRLKTYWSKVSCGTGAGGGVGAWPGAGTAPGAAARPSPRFRFGSGNAPGAGAVPVEPVRSGPSCSLSVIKITIVVWTHRVCPSKGFAAQCAASIRGGLVPVALLAGGGFPLAADRYGVPVTFCSEKTERMYPICRKKRVPVEAGPLV